jgi:radical SAM protein (TIGR01212 family)
MNYNSASEYYKKIFSTRVQKISIDAGFTCPNRDGTKGRGGCTYCNNDTFKPFYCSPKKTVTQQLSEGIDFFAKKYKSQKYLAYFQAYSNTYANIATLKKLYEEALQIDNIIGLVIATRPDCINDEILDYLSELSKNYYILLEFGVESTCDKTLKKINRGHTYFDTIKAVEMAAQRNLNVGLHLILGLPGENTETMLNHAKKISKLPFLLLKLHQLQIIKHTPMAIDYTKSPDQYKLFSLNDYIEFIGEFIQHLRPNILIERFTSEAPADLLIAPKWGRIKNYEIVHKIQNYLEKNNIFQGAKFNGRFI